RRACTEERPRCAESGLSAVMIPARAAADASSRSAADNDSVRRAEQAVGTARRASYPWSPSFGGRPLLNGHTFEAGGARAGAERPARWAAGWCGSEGGFIVAGI